MKYNSDLWDILFCDVPVTFLELLHSAEVLHVLLADT